MRKRHSNGQLRKLSKRLTKKQRERREDRIWRRAHRGGGF